jgi:hypothetical protein
VKPNVIEATATMMAVVRRKRSESPNGVYAEWDSGATGMG